MAVQGYSRGQIALHWIVAVLVAVQFLVEGGIGRAFRQGMREGGEFVLTGSALVHVAAGVLVLVLVLLRLSLRRSRGAPPPPEHDPAWQKLAAAVFHWGLNAALVAIPVSGLYAWFAASRGAAEVHEVLTSVLLALIGVHAAAALYGEFVQKTGVLRRIVLPEK
ncbi:MAG: cytochrome b/b6 domain-containing protein [Paracoccaceae bacterium]|nr:cytochrome b/b6 domain-containing protein [Paracoccaceae bacterium]